MSSTSPQKATANGSGVPTPRGRPVRLGGQFEYRRMSSMELEMIPLQKAVGASRAPEELQVGLVSSDGTSLTPKYKEGNLVVV